MTNERRAPYLSLATFFGCLLVATSSRAQLNEKCVVNVLNRTVQVSKNGGWTLPNVPSNQGKVRARATCINPNGATTAGQIQNLDPIPAQLQISPSAAIVLSSAGATAQLTVTAVYPNATTRDVSAGSSGTNYASSNPSVATVGPNGVVTAVASGFALISARKDGALGVTRVLVSTGGDADGDGMPDAYESAHGLNPNDPIDAYEDQDADGLSALGEYQKGTDPRNPDTDGDGLNDFVEVSVHSDPSNPNDHNFAAALTGLSVTPSALNLVFNTVVPDQNSQQLQVTGTLIDGSTVSLTSTARGTTYASSNLSICNFGQDPGRIYGTSPGSCQITVTNGSFQGS